MPGNVGGLEIGLSNTSLSQLSLFYDKLDLGLCSALALIPLMNQRLAVLILPHQSTFIICNYYFNIQ